MGMPGVATLENFMQSLQKVNDNMNETICNSSRKFDEVRKDLTTPVYDVIASVANKADGLADSISSGADPRMKEIEEQTKTTFPTVVWAVEEMGGANNTSESGNRVEPFTAPQHL